VERQHGRGVPRPTGVRRLRVAPGWWNSRTHPRYDEYEPTQGAEQSEPQGYDGYEYPRVVVLHLDLQYEWPHCVEQTGTQGYDRYE